MSDDGAVFEAPFFVIFRSMRRVRVREILSDLGLGYHRQPGLDRNRGKEKRSS